MNQVAKRDYQAPIESQSKGLLASMAERYSLAADIFEATMKSVAMPRDKEGNPAFTREEMISCLVVANEHNMNPLTKEIHFMRTKQGGIQPVVGYDGWVRKCNEHPEFDGLEFEDIMNEEGNMIACKCTIHRKDRNHATSITEYMDECAQPQGRYPGPWQKTPRRMLRNRTLTQAARLAFGFAGIMETDEFNQWQGWQPAEPSPPLELPTTGDPAPEPQVEAVPKVDDSIPFLEATAEEVEPEPEAKPITKPLKDTSGNEVPAEFMDDSKVSAGAIDVAMPEIQNEDPSFAEEPEEPTPPNVDAMPDPEPAAEDDGWPGPKVEEPEPISLDEIDFPSMGESEPVVDELSHGGLEWLPKAMQDIAECENDPTLLEEWRENNQHLIDRCRPDVAMRVSDKWEEAIGA